MSNTKQYTGAVLPNNPPFDKVAALCAFICHTFGLLAWPESLELEFWHTNEAPREEDEVRWATEGVFPIDIGKDKYHNREVGSATQVVVNDLGIADSDLRWLAKQANQNNETGFLKHAAYGYCMPWIVRELYKPGSFIDPKKVVLKAADVVFTELQLRRTPRSSWLREPTDLREVEGLKELYKGMFLSKKPFTIARYGFAMYVLGEDIEVIKAKLTFWVKAYNQAKRMNRVAQKKAEALTKREFRISGHLCYHFVTDDDRMARALFSRQKDIPSILLAERQNGSFQILTNRQLKTDRTFSKSVTVFCGRLQSIEYAPQDGPRAIWFNDIRINANLNGSRSLDDSPASILKADEVILLMRETLVLPIEEEEKGETMFSQYKKSAQEFTAAFVEMLQ